MIRVQEIKEYSLFVLIDTEVSLLGKPTVKRIVSATEYFNNLKKASFKTSLIMKMLRQA